MHPELVRLVALTDVDDAIATQERRLASASSAVPEAEETFRAAQDAVAVIEQELEAHSVIERKTERDLELYRKRLERAVQALEAGAGDAAAAERQRVQCIEIIDRLETESLELMERRDDIEQRLAGVRDHAAAMEAAIAAAAEASAPEIEQAKAQLVDLKGQRRAQRPQIDPPELTRYDAMRARRRRPISPVIDGACKACNRMIVANRMQDLKKERLERCGGCGRWLVL